MSNFVIPEAYQQKIATALGFASLSDAVDAVKALPLDEYGYAEIRKGGAFIQKTNNTRSYASIICGGGKCGMSRDWAVSYEYLTPRGRMLANGIMA